jgi:hypothetical protein
LVVSTDWPADLDVDVIRRSPGPESDDDISILRDCYVVAPELTSALTWAG